MIKYSIEHRNAKDPVAGSNLAAGFDLHVAEIIKHDRKDFWVDTGVAFDIPEGLFGDLRARSSISNLPIYLVNGAGVIDPDFRGTVQFRFRFNETSMYNRRKVPYRVGDRCGQIIFTPYLNHKIKRTNDLSETERGQGGFGSTGD